MVRQLPVCSAEYSNCNVWSGYWSWIGYNDQYWKMQTILVIDDDESLRDTIGMMLEQDGFRAIVSGDGRDGFDKALTNKPDLVLVDLRLPGMSGTEICKQLRAARLNTPIIVLSALGDEVDKVLLLEIGADDYMVKPFGTRELMARIRAVLRRDLRRTPAKWSTSPITRSISSAASCAAKAKS